MKFSYRCLYFLEELLEIVLQNGYSNQAWVESNPIQKHAHFFRLHTKINFKF